MPHTSGRRTAKRRRFTRNRTPSTQAVEHDYHFLTRHLTESLGYNFSSSNPDVLYRQTDTHIFFARLQQKAGTASPSSDDRPLHSVRVGGRPFDFVDRTTWYEMLKEEAARLRDRGLEVQADTVPGCYMCDRIPPKGRWSDRRYICDICHDLAGGRRCKICHEQKQPEQTACSVRCEFLLSFRTLDRFQRILSTENLCTRQFNRAPFCRGCFKTIWADETVDAAQARRLLELEMTTQPETHHISYEPEQTVTLCKSCHAKVTALRIHEQSDPRYDHFVARQDRPEPEPTFAHVPCTLCDGRTRVRIDVDPVKPVCSTCIEQQCRTSKLAMCHVCERRQARLSIGEDSESAICHRCKKRRERRRSRREKKQKRRAQSESNSDYIPVRKARKPWRDD